MPGRTTSASEAVRPLDGARPKSSPHHLTDDVPTGSVYLASLEGETTTEGHLGKIHTAVALLLDSARSTSELARSTNERVQSAVDESTGAKVAAKSALVAVKIQEQRSQQRHTEVMARLKNTDEERAQERAALLVDLATLMRQGSLHEADITIVKKKLTGRQIATYVASVGFAVGLIEAALRLLGMH